MRSPKDRTVYVWRCVEIKFRTPHAIDATSSPQLHLLDGVEILRHHLISTQVRRVGFRRLPGVAPDQGQHDIKDAQ